MLIGHAAGWSFIQKVYLDLTFTVSDNKQVQGLHAGIILKSAFIENKKYDPVIFTYAY